MNYKDIVKENSKVMQFIKDRTPGDNNIDMYFGTLDYATARLNTILLRLSERPLLADEYAYEVSECHSAVQDFFKYTERLRFGSKLLAWYYKIVLHGIGTRRISKIKKLLTKVEDNA
tara:strand:+ start:503 stop:853 length:351 start_codon:yes stop_codon:yes gene_type:complete